MRRQLGSLAEVLAGLLAATATLVDARKQDQAVGGRRHQLLGFARLALGSFEKAGLKVVAAKYKQLSRREAEGFYAVHRERPFFNALVEFMISGPVMIQALEGENAVLAHRDLLGATNPKEAAPGTIRADFAESIDANAAHGSDSVENAAIEIAYFFAATEVVSR